jgi:hypothetical protein
VEQGKAGQLEVSFLGEFSEFCQFSLLWSGFLYFELKFPEWGLDDRFCEEESLEASVKWRSHLLVFHSLFF